MVSPMMRQFGPPGTQQFPTAQPVSDIHFLSVFLSTPSPTTPSWTNFPLSLKTEHLAHQPFTCAPAMLAVGLFSDHIQQWTLPSLGQKTSRSSHDTCFLRYLHPLKSSPMNEGEFPFLMRFQWGGIFQTLTISGIFFGGVKNLLRFKRLLSSLSTTLVLAETESWVMPMPWEWKQVSQQLKKWVAQWKERGTCICQLLDN